MSFRRSKNEGHRVALWSQFKRDAADLWQASGVPGWVCDSEHDFQLFLMHGCHFTPNRSLTFDVVTLSKSQKVALRELVVRYLALGFGDPGLMLFGGDEDEAIRNEASRRRQLTAP